MADQGDGINAIPQQQDRASRLAKKPREKKPKAENPITVAVKKWLATVSQAPGGSGLDDQTQQLLLDSAPKRWAIYEPMVLLPSSSFTSDVWRTALETEASAAHLLWGSILASLSLPSAAAAPLTHLAINEGIPPHSGPARHENVLRSPGDSLRMLHGDFGPADADDHDDHHHHLDRAFWVSTRQNGILQTWAPRWTMFSRGNVKEKARLLSLLQQNNNNSRNWAVDLYAGIGYFAFSYAARGLRVLAWELNPWSVEGLRRGGERNGWRIRVVREPQDLARHTGELLLRTGEDEDEDARIVVFQESNAEAARRVRELRGAMVGGVEIRHVNCGFLPSSLPTWRTALGIVAGNSSSGGGGWLHLHENVGVKQIGARAVEVQGMLRGWAVEDQEAERREEYGETTVEVTHTEMVKTFAPDVWHCVFDVRVGRAV